MIELQFCSRAVLVFNVDDWVTLRKTHRILGEFLGNITQTVQTLPLKLLPEEALLLLDKGVAKIVDQQSQHTPEIGEKYKQFEDEMLTQQRIVQKNIRKKQLEAMIDDIVAAKRKRGDERPSEEILNEELEKSCKVTKDNMIWPVLVTPLCPGNSTEITRDVILEDTSSLKYAIYKDLWEKGYYVTTGHKFGGDFLVYLGDPIAYHAIFIVHCIEDPEQSIHSSEIVAFGRLATSVKKRAVLASLSSDNSVSYITINWIDA